MVQQNFGPVLGTVKGCMVAMSRASLSSSGGDSTDDSQEVRGGSTVVEWPMGELAKAWEANHVIRARGRASQALLKWPSAKTKGIASMQAIHMNADCLLLFAQKWCPLLATAKSPSVRLLRPEVVAWRKEMNLEEDLVLVYLDTWGLRRLFSLAVRRRGASRKSRDVITDEFFSTMVAHWGVFALTDGDDDAPAAAVDLSEDEEAGEAIVIHTTSAAPATVSADAGEAAVPEEDADARLRRSLTDAIVPAGDGHDALTAEEAYPNIDGEEVEHSSSWFGCLDAMDEDDLLLAEGQLLAELALLKLLDCTRRNQISALIWTIR